MSAYPEFGQGGLSADDPVRHPVDESAALRVSLRDAISAHIEKEAREYGTYHGDPTATPGGSGYCIPAAVATQIVDKYLLEYLDPEPQP